MTTRRFAGVLALVLLGTTAVSAQILDDTWFKVKVKARGTTISSSGSLSPDTIKAEGYMHLTFSDEAEGIVGGEFYDVDLFVENNSGEFVPGEAKGLQLFREGNNGFASTALLFGAQAEGLPDFDLVLIIQAFGQVRLRLTSEGSLKSARMRSAAGIAQALDPDTEGTEDVLVGGIRLRAKTIPVSKLPFSPPSML